MNDLERIEEATQDDNKYQQAISNVGCRVVSTLLRKNADYGGSVFEPPVLAPKLASETSILVRLSDKIKRLNHLLSGNEQQIKEESIDDTIKDLAGYSILYLVAKELEDDE